MKRKLIERKQFIGEVKATPAQQLIDWRGNYASSSTANNQAEPTKAIAEWISMKLKEMKQCWRLNEAWFAVGYGR